MHDFKQSTTEKIFHFLANILLLQLRSSESILMKVRKKLPSVTNLKYHQQNLSAYILEVFFILTFI